MLIYLKFFDLIQNRQLSQYQLTHDLHISSSLIYKLRQSTGQDPKCRPIAGISTRTLIKICNSLHCLPQDIFEQDLTNDDNIRQIIQLARSKKY